MQAMDNKYSSIFIIIVIVIYAFFNYVDYSLIISVITITMVDYINKWADDNEKKHQFIWIFKGNASQNALKCGFILLIKTFTIYY